MGRGGADWLGVLGLAVLWHDPPWKPWGITGHRVSGSGGDVPERIVNAMGEWKGKVQAEYKRLIEGAGGIPSHERQSVILVAAVAVKLEEKGLEDLAGYVRRAGSIIAGRDPWSGTVRAADVLAAALDRLLLEKATGGKQARDAGVQLVNPFNPNHKLNSIPDEIDARLIADFINEYAEALATAASISKCKSPVCLLHLAYLLLEPVWYKVTGKSGRVYAPPADTRIPTHTVFDHVDAALTTLLWVAHGGEGDPSGCIVVVDLAGVQSWIRESRRLRDLWASSWLASLLAWKSVEYLVDVYGPGAMIQPPGRLHPFYTSKHLGPVLDKTSKSIPRMDWLWEASGLSLRWPVDPVSPSRVTIALPEEACSDAENMIKDGYIRAWRMILEEVVKETEYLISEQNNREQNNDETLKLVRSLEPPLALRVIKVSIREAFNRAKKLARERGLDPEVYSKLLFYPLVMLSMIPEEEAKTRLVASGRRSGPVYHKLATHIYNKRDRIEFCTVCGHGVAVIDGERIQGYNQRYRVLAGEIGRDRLCPYCLAKRLLRYVLTKYDDEIPLAKRLTGIPMSEEARRRLMYSTVDVYTVRTRLNIERIYNTVNSIADKLDDVGLDSFHLLVHGLPRNRFLPYELHSKLVQKLKNKLKNEYDSDVEELADRLQALVLEILHDDAFWNGYKERISSLIAAGDSEKIKIDDIIRFVDDIVGSNEVKGVKRSRRKYALLAMDGDYMGSGVLRGSLRETAGSYADYINKAVNIGGDNSSNNAGLADKVKRELAGIVGNALDILRSVDFRCKAEGDDDCELTVPVTPSYHMTVSRALAALAHLDRMLVERLGGSLIYAGGDDLLAVLPGAMPGGTSADGEGEHSGRSREVSIPALEAAVKARHRYWGYNGFIHPGSYDVHTVVPALAAYGRSGAVYLVDSKRPLWMSLEELRILEDSKDHTVFNARGVEGKKDALFVASDSGGAVILPFRLYYERDGWRLYRPDRPITILVNLMRSTGSPRVSRSLVEDYIVYKDAVHRLSYTLGDPGVVYSIIREVFSRNISEGVMHGKKLTADTLLLDCLIPSLKGWDCMGSPISMRPEDIALLVHTHVSLHDNAPSARMASMTGLMDYDGREYTAPLLTMLIGASRIIYSSL